MKNKRAFRFWELGLTLLWGLWMQNTTGEFSAYLAVLCLGLFSWTYLGHTRPQMPNGRLINGFTALLTACVVLGNISRILWPWPYFLSMNLTRLFGLALVTAGSWITFRNIFLALFALSEQGGGKEKKPGKKDGAKVFFAVWLLLLAGYSLVLWLAFYPGILSVDNINQLKEITGINAPSNTNPFYHTQLIGLIYRLGLALTGDMSMGVAFYSQFSVTVMSACFAYGVYVLWQETRCKWASVLLAAFYLVSPMFFMYSFTMWKDVLFSGAVMTFALAMYRTVRGAKGAAPLGGFSALAMCLMRVNGVLDLAVVLLFGLLLVGKDQKKLLLSLSGVAVLGYILVFPLLSCFGIEKSGSLEPLSVPLQQIGYLISEDYSLSQEDRDLLGQVVDLEEAAEAYKSFSVDPLKQLILQKGNAEALQSNWLQYLRLYFRLGLRYPLAYLQAWSEQTKGYWEGGHAYDRWNIKIDGNPWGLSVEPKVSRLQSLVIQYLNVWESSYLTRLPLCLGLYFWACLGCLFVGRVQKDPAMTLAALPFLAVVLLLAVGTPVFAEFRYGFPLVCGVPVLLLLTVCRLGKSGNP